MNRGDEFKYPGIERGTLIVVWSPSFRKVCLNLLKSPISDLTTGISIFQIVVLLIRGKHSKGKREMLLLLVLVLWLSLLVQRTARVKRSLAIAMARKKRLK